MAKTDNANTMELEDNNEQQNQPNESARFAAYGMVFSWFEKYFYKFKHSPEIKVDPFDSIVMTAHYNFTSHLLFTVFTFVTSNWLVAEPIICVDQHDKSDITDDMLEICQTYPYVEYPRDKDRNDMKRRYALYYKWVHIVCLILSLMFKAVLLAKNIFSNKNHREMLQKVYETKDKDRFCVAKSYYTNFRGCHNKMYARFLYAHLAAFFVNAVCFIGLNTTFQNNYWDMPTKLFVQRDAQKFHDEFSLIFPPFAMCDITPEHHILVDRSMWFGCHLTLNEMYEKIFMMFWFWQVFLMIWTVLYILYHIIPLSFNFKWKLNLITSSRFYKYHPYSRCAKILSVDDLFALKSVSSYLVKKDYIKLLSSLTFQRRRNLSTSSKSSNDSNDLIYYDDESQMKSSTCRDTTMDQTILYSCKKKFSDKFSKIPIGFEALGASPNFKGSEKLIGNKFERSTNHLDTSKTAKNEHGKVSAAATAENHFTIHIPKNKRAAGSSSRFCSTPEYDLDNKSTQSAEDNATPLLKDLNCLSSKKLEPKFSRNTDFSLDDSKPTKKSVPSDSDWLKEKPPHIIPKEQAVKKPSAPEESDFSNNSENENSPKKSEQSSKTEEKPQKRKKRGKRSKN